MSVHNGVPVCPHNVHVAYCQVCSGPLAYADSVKAQAWDVSSKLRRELNETRAKLQSAEAEVERLLRAKLADAKEAGKQLAEVTAIVRTARLAGSTSTNGESQQKESDVRDDELKAMVDAFLAWPLPADVAADAIACKPGAPHRTGTNLLTSVQARAMFEHCLAVVRAHDSSLTRR